MTTNRTKTIRRELDRLPRGNAGLEQLAAEVVKRIDAGDDVRTWADIEQRFQHIPEEPALVAVQELAREDLPELLGLFSRANPLGVLAVTRFLPWSDAFGDLWIRTRSSRSIAALGVLTWLRNPGNDVVFIERLGRIGTALATRPRLEEIAIWWQVLGIASRLCSTTSPGLPPRMEALYQHAATALARNGGGDALPTATQFELWSTGNRELAAVLPSVAYKAREEHRSELLGAFFADAERRLEGELHELPDVTTPGGVLYVNACGQAVAMEVSTNATKPWWETKLGQYVERMEGWHADLSAAAMERAAWISCAVSVAALKLATVPEKAAAATLVSRLFELMEPRIPEWLWETGYPPSARVALPELVVRAAMIEPETAADRVMGIARVARDSMTLVMIKREAVSILSPACLEELNRLYSEHADYERALGLTPAEALA